VVIDEELGAGRLQLEPPCDARGTEL